MTKIKNMNWELEVRDDLFGIQHPEDGSEYTASVFYITATAADGRRFAHDHRFHSAEAFSGYESDGEWYAGISSFREEALAKAEALLARMMAAQATGRWTSPVDREHWYEIDPVYGSEAYIGAEPELVAREKAEAFDLF